MEHSSISKTVLFLILYWIFVCYYVIHQYFMFLFSLKILKTTKVQSISSVFRTVAALMKVVSRYRKVAMRCAMISLTAPLSGKLKSWKSYLKNGTIYDKGASYKIVEHPWFSKIFSPPSKRMKNVLLIAAERQRILKDGILFINSRVYHETKF